jgi:hypothetical protein
MSKVRGGRVRFDPDRILMSGGATGANELIMFCLADPGDAFLVPSPYYPAYVTFLFHYNIYVFIQCMFTISHKPSKWTQFKFSIKCNKYFVLI